MHSGVHRHGQMTIIENKKKSAGIERCLELGRQNKRGFSGLPLCTLETAPTGLTELVVVVEESYKEPLLIMLPMLKGAWLLR